MKASPPRVRLRIRWTGRPVDRPALRRLARRVLTGEGRSDAAVTLLLTDDAELHRLNRDFRRKDRPTDVLSFPAGPGDDDDPGFLGDVALSVERALDQAPRFSAGPDEEVARLVVHGLLHLLGYDHHAPADGRRMKARERLYLAEVSSGSILPA